MVESASTDIIDIVIDRPYSWMKMYQRNWTCSIRFNRETVVFWDTFFKSPTFIAVRENMEKSGYFKDFCEYLKTSGIIEREIRMSGNINLWDTVFFFFRILIYFISNNSIISSQFQEINGVLSSCVFCSGHIVVCFSLLRMKKY